LRDSPLYIPRPRNFGIGRDIQPKRDLTRFVHWPKYVRIQRQKRILMQRLKIPGTINQFNYTADKNTSHAVFKLLKLYQPETRTQRHRRLKATAKLIFLARQDKEKAKKLLAAKSEKRAKKLASKRIQRNEKAKKKRELRKVKNVKEGELKKKRKELRKQKRKELGPKPKKTPTGPIIAKKPKPPRELLKWKRAHLKLKHENAEQYKTELKAKKIEIHKKKAEERKKLPEKERRKLRVAHAKAERRRVKTLADRAKKKSASEEKTKKKTKKTTGPKEEARQKKRRQEREKKLKAKPWLDKSLDKKIAIKLKRTAKYEARLALRKLKIENPTAYAEAMKKKKERKALIKQQKNLAKLTGSASVAGKRVIKKQKVITYGLDAVTKLVESRKAKLVIIANDVDPLELVLWLPTLCKKKNIPYMIVKGKAALGQICHKRTNSVIAFTSVHKRHQKDLDLLIQKAKDNFLDRYSDIVKKSGGQIMGAKHLAKKRKVAKLAAQVDQVYTMDNAQKFAELIIVLYLLL